jgi:MFS family permease
MRVGSPILKDIFGTGRVPLNGANCLAVGSFVGAIACSIVGETIGRRKSVGIGSCFMIAGATLQATSYSLPQMIVGRITAGIGMGFLNSTTPVMQSEYSPQEHRGKCKSLHMAFLYPSGS